MELRLGSVVVLIIVVLVWWWIDHRRTHRFGISEGAVPVVHYRPTMRTDGRTEIWRSVRRSENLRPTLEEQLRFNCYRLDPDFRLSEDQSWFSPIKRVSNGHYQGYLVVRFIRVSGS